MRSEFSTKQGDSEKGRRLDELPQAEQRRASPLIDDRSEPVGPQKPSASQSALTLTPRRSTSVHKEKTTKIETQTRMEDQPNVIDLRTTLKTKDELKIKVCPLSLSSWLVNKVWFAF
jgi:hypothetical protein